jgi:hypothetical protein
MSKNCKRTSVAQINGQLGGRDLKADLSPCTRPCLLVWLRLMKTRKRKKAEKGWAIELTPVAVQTTSTAQLGEVAGLNAGGQLRRARRGDDDDEALATKNTGASDSSEEASAFSETPVAGAICGAIPAVGGNPAPMCLEAKQHLEQLADAQRAVDAWHRDANPAWHVFKAVSTSDGVAVQCLACPTQKGNGQTKFFKFGPLGNAKPTGSFDFGQFVARRGRFVSASNCGRRVHQPPPRLNGSFHCRRLTCK